MRASFFTRAKFVHAVGALALLGPLVGVAPAVAPAVAASVTLRKAAETHRAGAFAMIAKMREAIVAFVICSKLRGAIKPLPTKPPACKTPTRPKPAEALAPPPLVRRHARVLPRFMRRRVLVFDDEADQFVAPSVAAKCPDPGNANLRQRSLRSFAPRIVRIPSEMCMHVFSFLKEADFYL